MSEEKFVERTEKLAKKAEKSGFMTSEFWAAAATTIIGLAGKLGLFGAESAIAQALSSILITAGPIVYIVARCGVKKALGEIISYLAEAQKKG